MMAPPESLGADVLQRFWGLPDGMVDWQYEKQALLFTKMQVFATEYDQLVQHGDTKAFSGAHLSDSIWFGFHDRFALYTLVRHFKPNRIIEVGSGDSTKVANLAIVQSKKESRGEYNCKHVCIDPFRSKEIAIPVDPPEIIQGRVETVPIDMFDELESGDLLFIDSTHVARPFGDVVFELVHLLPRLKAGVIVHVHDIKFPFYQRNFLEKQ
eukprot:SAG31_NODE_3285_length_4464_cov_2.238259_1_plen_211_part_00